MALRRKLPLRSPEHVEKSELLHKAPRERERERGIEAPHRTTNRLVVAAGDPSPGVLLSEEEEKKKKREICGFHQHIEVERFSYEHERNNVEVLI